MKQLLEFKYKLWHKYFLRQLPKNHFTIISNDCWGGQIYKLANRPYSTPFIGLMIMAPCFIKIVENLKEYLQSPLTFIDESKYKMIEKKYPIGLLKGDVELHFLHYKSEDEALQKWDRRKSRINWENIFLKFDSSKDFCTEEMEQRFHKLSYPKICFGNQYKKDLSNYVYLPGWTNDGAKMFPVSLKYFNIGRWLKKKGVKDSMINKFLTKTLMPESFLYW